MWYSGCTLVMNVHTHLLSSVNRCMGAYLQVAKLYDMLYASLTESVDSQFLLPCVGKGKAKAEQE